MSRKVKALMNPEDLRDQPITVRLTCREKDVVEGLCSVYSCSKSSLLRMLYTFSLPPVVPELNVKAFAVLEQISYQLVEFSDIEFSHSPQLEAALYAVERSLDQLRNSLLEPP